MVPRPLQKLGGDSKTPLVHLLIDPFFMYSDGGSLISLVSFLTILHISELFHHEIHIFPHLDLASYHCI